jgi:hypothetical protein
MSRTRTLNMLMTLVYISILLVTNLIWFQLGSSIEVSSSYFSICSHKSFTTSNRIQFDNSSYFLHHYPHFICPQNFRNLADWIYGWPEGVFDELLEYPMKNNRFILPHLPRGSIIFVKTDSLPSFFSEVYPHVMHEFVLITGQGDASTPSNYLSYLERSDSKIIHWFGQNGDIDALQSEKFTHIPIGEYSSKYLYVA